MFCIGFLSDSALSIFVGPNSGLAVPTWPYTIHLIEVCQPEVADHFTFLRGVLDFWYSSLPIAYSGCAETHINVIVIIVANFPLLNVKCELIKNDL